MRQPVPAPLGAVPAVLLFVLALVPRLALLAGAETYRFDPADRYVAAGYEIGRVAASLAEGRGFELSWGTEPAPTAWIAPAYPYAVGLVFRLFGSLTVPSFAAVLLFQIVLSAATAALLYVLAARLGLPAVGLVAGGLFALSAPAVRESAELISSVSLLLLLLVLVALALLELERRPSPGRAALTGALMGGTLLVEPSPAAFFVAGAGWLMARRKGEGLRAALLMGLVAALVVSPWIARNHRVFGGPIFVKSNFGQELFIGNNPESTGFWAPPGAVMRRVLEPPVIDRLDAAYRTGDEPLFSRILGAAALDHVRDHPGRAARLTAAKIGLFWGLEYVEPSWPLGGRAKAVIGGASRAVHLAVLALAVTGAILALRARSGLVLAVLFLAVYPVTYYLTHVGHDRYRLPTVAFLHLLAAYAVVRAGKRARSSVGR